MDKAIYGIDVSRHQGNIDWGMVRNSGTSFAFVSAGFSGYDGRITNEGLDIRFRRNMKEANKVGLPVGAFLCLYARSEDAAQLAARQMLELVSDFAMRCPLAVQIDDEPYRGCSVEETTAIARSFLWTVEEAGYYPMLSTYPAFAERQLDMRQLAAYDLWLADYADRLDYEGGAHIWQFDNGACDGVPAACHLNVSRCNYPVMIAAAGLNRPGVKLTDSQIDMKRVLLRTLAEVT